MSLKYSYSFAPAAASLTGFLSNATGATWTLTATAATDTLAHRVSIRNDSATDHSGKTATLVGTDADGVAQTEVVTLPGTSATVESTYYFKTLTSITPSATIGGDTMDIGWVDEFVSPTIMLGSVYDGSGAFVHVEVSGTINYSVQVTAAGRDVYTGQASLPWMDTDAADLVGTGTNNSDTLEVGAVATRFVVNSYSTGATADVYFSEGGGGC